MNVFISRKSSQYRSNWNMEDEVESAVRPPTGHDGVLYNGVNEHDSSSETSTYSESSSNTLVRLL